MASNGASKHALSARGGLPAYIHFEAKQSVFKKEVDVLLCPFPTMILADRLLLALGHKAVSIYSRAHLKTSPHPSSSPFLNFLPLEAKTLC